MTRVEEEDVRALVRRFADSRASHLELAVLADRVAALATRIARGEVISARSEGATWAEVGDAFGVTTQTAHERFRSGPDGLASRYAQRHINE